MYIVKGKGVVDYIGGVIRARLSEQFASSVVTAMSFIANLHMIVTF